MTNVARNCERVADDVEGESAVRGVVVGMSSLFVEGEVIVYSVRRERSICEEQAIRPPLP